MNSYLNDRKAIDRLKREYLEHKKLIVAFDFDSTVFDYHDEGLILQPVIDLLKQCNELNFSLVLFTTEEDEEKLQGKVSYCYKLGFAPDHVNSSPIFTEAKKPYFNILLDDRAGLSASYNILLTTLKELELWD